MYALTSTSGTNGLEERNGGLDVAEPAARMGNSGRCGARAATSAWEGGSGIEKERVGGLGRRDVGGDVVEGVATGSPTT